MTRIVVVGMGYVGIPAAALLADVDGFTVTGMQRRSARSGWKIDLLNQGKNPIGGNEPGLAELLERVVLKKKSFSVVDDIGVCRDADYILVDVQTPTDKDHVPRYESLRDVSAQIAPLLKEGATVIIESTVAPGTTNNIVRPILDEKSGKKAGVDFHLIFSYERVMVGRLIHNIVNYPRIVGGIDEASTEKGLWLYKHIVKAGVVATDALTAETAKVVENTYRDVNIAFSNEVALICESLGIDAWEVRKLVNTLPNDPSNPAANPHRNMHFPGAGVGGHCLPKDSWLLKYGVDTYGSFKVVPKVIMESRYINEFMPAHVAAIVEELLLAGNVPMKDARIAVLGYAFLENSDDTRNTPTEIFLDEIKKKGAIPVVHDPHVRIEEIDFIKRDLWEVLQGAHVAVIMTRHDEYREMDLARLVKALAHPILVDGRNTFTVKQARDAGLTYRGIGKGN